MPHRIEHKHASDNYQALLDLFFANCESSGQEFSTIIQAVAASGEHCRLESARSQPVDKSDQSRDPSNSFYSNLLRFLLPHK